ncbi:hypothetical protein ABT095_14365 [Kitasatospora sp. NPDC002227]|uniref:hypothetical protein n=1 Tax=Kitasatospora sp. NPDC002227 TaxID=3154773 RepID=UPI003321408A
MSAELSDRDWEAFMGSALGISVSESGLLVDTDQQQNFTRWFRPEPVKPTGSATSEG